MLGPDALPASSMTAEERIAEVGQILPLGPNHRHGHKSSSLSANGLIDVEAGCSELAEHPLATSANRGISCELQYPSDEATCQPDRAGRPT